MDRINATPDQKRALRECLGSFATGVTVVTTLDEDGMPRGLVVNSFASVSLEPPLISWNLSLTSPSLQAFRHYEAFAVNVMGLDDKDMTMQFARPIEDKFKDVDWRPGYRGVPLLEKAVAVFSCTTEKRIVIGDHEMFIGRVKEFVHDHRPPLVFHRGAFTKLSDGAHQSLQ